MSLGFQPNVIINCKESRGQLAESTISERLWILLGQKQPHKPHPVVSPLSGILVWNPKVRHLTARLKQGTSDLGGCPLIMSSKNPFHSFGDIFTVMESLNRIRPYIFSCPEQLNSCPCHSLTDSLTQSLTQLLLLLPYKEQSLRLATIATFD